MSVLISGMEIPKRGHTVTLTITGGGEAVVQYYDCKPRLTVPIVYKTVPVSPHGPLVDALDIINAFPDEYVFTNEQARALTNYIIPADKEEEDV